jgi:hypothetical protein
MHCKSQYGQTCEIFSSNILKTPYKIEERSQHSFKKLEMALLSSPASL